MRSAPTPQARRRLRVLPITIVSLVIFALIAGGWWVTRPRTLYARLAAIAPDRVIAPRTSLEVPYHQCAVAETDSLVPAANCLHRSAPGEEIDKLESEADLRLEEKEGADEDAARTLGMIALHGSRGQAPKPAEAIDLFDSALRVTHDSAGVMTDLSAAYLVQAGESQSSDDLQRALEWSDWALELQPRSAPAMFNRALALEALTADISARKAWRELLAADQPTGLARYLPWGRAARWRREAEQRLNALNELTPHELPENGASEAVWRKFVMEHPQQGRRHGWETVLPEWAAAVENGNVARADTLLRLAEVIGDAVYRRPNGDAMLHDQVAAIREMVPRGAGVRALVEAYRVEQAATEARTHFKSGRADSLLSLLDARSLPLPQEIWVALRHAAAIADLAAWDRATQVLDAADAKIDTLKYPVAAGYSRWLRGTVFLRTERYDSATAVLQSAEALYGRTGERASRGMVEGFIADAQSLSGNADAANEWTQRSARTMRALGPSVAQHNGRQLAAISAQVAGLNRAMRDLADDDVAVAEAFGETPFIDEALLNRAALMAAVGQKERALQDMDRASSPDSLQPAVRPFFVMRRAYARALVQLDTHPDSVDATVRPLLAYRGSELWRTSGLALRARAALAVGDAVRAAQDLDSVFVAQEGRSRSGGAEQRRGLNDVRPALLKLVSLLAERGDTVGALRLLNRGAVALAPIQVGDGAFPRSVPDDRVVIRPLLAGNTLLVWTLTGSRVEMTRTRVDPARLKRAISAVQYALPRSFNADEDRAYLYGLLVRPAERWLGRSTDHLQVVFVHDDDLGGIPFVALLDSARRPLVADHPVWSAVSLAAAVAPADTTLPDSVAFFAPKFNPVLNPLLDSLPNAGSEVRDASRGYGSRVIAAEAQTPDEFLRVLRRANVIHFAGHAVSDEFRPDRSYLVLEPGAGRPNGHLAAASLDSTPIPNVRLVVLSACTTLGGDGASQGFTGLSGALLDAGVRGVVGSLWAVDDGPTAKLMVKFHERYLLTRDPARALWEAQRAMMMAGDSTTNTPAVWAAFRYVGR
jgi:CHAT domain-containing protein